MLNAVTTHQVDPSVTADERQWGMIAHFAALAAFLVPPIGGVLGPLVVWLVKREQSTFVAEAAKEASRMRFIRRPQAKLGRP